MKIVRRPLALLVLIAIILATGGCSSFERAWRNPPDPSNGIAGRWEGSWQSARSGDRGRLRAIITPQNATQYRARFHATYHSVFTADYSVTLDVKRRGENSQFRGAAHLGLWGRYETTGDATARQFRAKYRSKFDHGTFDMQRVSN
jgi:hypothetical protein